MANGFFSDGAPEDVALEVWQYGSNDDVWTAVFELGVEVAGELLTKIENSPDFTVGDLTHEQVVASIRRRWPILI